jgi:hypothetical protein
LEKYRSGPRSGALHRRPKQPLIAETEKPPKPLPAPNIYPLLIMLGDQGGSIISQQGGQMDQSLENRIRERAYEIWTTWLRARPSRSALACGRAGNPGGINARARRQTGPEKEATVAWTFEGRQNARAGRLTPHITPEMLAPVRRQSER